MTTSHSTASLATFVRALSPPSHTCLCLKRSTPEPLSTLVVGVILWSAKCNQRSFAVETASVDLWGHMQLSLTLLFGVLQCSSSLGSTHLHTLPTQSTRQATSSQHALGLRAPPLFPPPRPPPVVLFWSEVCHCWGLGPCGETSYIARGVSPFMGPPAEHSSCAIFLLTLCCTLSMN